MFMTDFWMWACEFSSVSAEAKVTLNSGRVLERKVLKKRSGDIVGD